MDLPSFVRTLSLIFTVQVEEARRKTVPGELKMENK